MNSEPAAGAAAELLTPRLRLVAADARLAEALAAFHTRSAGGWQAPR